MIHPNRRDLEISVLRHMAHHPAEIIDWIHPRLFLDSDAIAAAKWLQRAAVTEDISGAEVPDLARKAIDRPAPPGDPLVAMQQLLHESALDLRDLLRWEVANFDDDPFAQDNLDWVERLIKPSQWNANPVDTARLLLVAVRFAGIGPRPRS